jgi:hypothetical protein
METTVSDPALAGAPGYVGAVPPGAPPRRHSRRGPRRSVPAGARLPARAFAPWRRRSPTRLWQAHPVTWGLCPPEPPTPSLAARTAPLRSGGRAPAGARFRAMETTVSDPASGGLWQAHPVTWGLCPPEPPHAVTRGADRAAPFRRARACRRALSRHGDETVSDPALAGAPGYVGAVPPGAPPTPSLAARTAPLRSGGRAPAGARTLCA